MLKAEADGHVIGFFIVERRADGGMYWHLTAIAPEFQGQGYGLALWQTMLSRHRGEEMAFVETTISAHNLAALSLYSRLGFSFTSAQMTFHRLADGSAVTP
jgi:ribosomal protein S18 acetylase RimI-like enzyme